MKRVYSSCDGATRPQPRAGHSAGNNCYYYHRTASHTFLLHNLNFSYPHTSVSLMNSVVWQNKMIVFGGYIHLGSATHEVG